MTDDTLAPRFFDWVTCQGLALSPIAPNSKIPLSESEHPTRFFTKDRAEWQRWRDSGYNFALPAAPNGLIVVDIDPRNGGHESWEAWQAQNGEFDIAWITQSGGAHCLFRAPADCPLTERKLGPGLDIKVNGYALCPPSQIDSRRYFMPRVAVIHTPPAALIEHLAKVTRAERTAEIATPGDYDAGDVAKMVAFLNEAGSFEAYEDWLSVGMALKLCLGDAGFEIWQSVFDGEVTAVIAETKWRSFSTEPSAGCVTLASWMKKAHAAGWKGTIRKSSAAMFGDVAAITSLPVGAAPGPAASGGNSLTAPRGDVLPYDSDDCLALDFVSRYANELRYVNDTGKYLWWDGTRWKPDRTSGAYTLIRSFIRELAVGLVLPEARKVASAQKVSAVERMVRTDPRIVTTADMWDANPWLLCTPGGTLDLQTGQLREASPNDAMTKITAAAPSGECPLFLSFLNKSLAGDIELMAFLQRALGYSLTGITREHQLFFIHGEGGNGKGVLMNTIAALVGDYSRTATAETFLASQFEKHPTDIAGLAGARIVVASEVPRGRHWDEVKLKSVTGGDRMTARFMRQDFFDFVPVLKLWIVGNNTPRIRTVDEAIRRRMNLIEFNVKIPESERDPNLSEKLKAEYGGILQWLVEGCLTWQRCGLQPPNSVKLATENYLAAQDSIASWLEDCCAQSSDLWASRNSLFESWSRWAQRAGEPIGSRPEFLDSIRRLFAESGKNGVRGFKGIQIAIPQIPNSATGLPPLPYLSNAGVQK